MNESIRVEIYSRPGCHLCDEAKEVIERVRRRIPFDLRIINVEKDPQLEKDYGEKIPVVLIGGSPVFNYQVNEAEFEDKVKTLWTL
jgi:glutaredoxin